MAAAATAANEPQQTSRRKRAAPRNATIAREHDAPLNQATTTANKEKRAKKMSFDDFLVVHQVEAKAPPFGLPELPTPSVADFDAALPDLAAFLEVRLVCAWLVGVLVWCADCASGRRSVGRLVQRVCHVVGTRHFGTTKDVCVRWMSGAILFFELRTAPHRTAQIRANDQHCAPGRHSLARHAVEKTMR